MVTICLPEALRVRGGIATGPRPDPDEAEALFRQSLGLSRRQGARAGVAHSDRPVCTVGRLRSWSVGLTDARTALLQPVFGIIGKSWIPR